MKIGCALFAVALSERVRSGPNSRSKRQNLAVDEAAAPAATTDDADERRGKNNYDNGAAASSYDNGAAASTYDTGAAASGTYGATGYEATGLKCWHCDAMSFEDCEAKGQEKSCHANQGSCFLEIRERRQNGDAGDFMQICMGCKSEDACTNMKSQNFQNQNPDYTQCRPEANYSDSVCRQCCDTDNCTRDPDWWFPQSREEWDYTGEEETYTGYKK